MSSSRLLNWLLFFLISVPTLAETRNKPAFNPLFNGHDLQGWVEMGEKGAFVVEAPDLVLANPRYYPTWLRTEKEYENFELSLEFLMPGWCEAGLLLNAPLYGRLSRTGIKIHLRHNDQDEGTHSFGAIYGVLAPLVRPVKKEKWNHLEVYLEWPRLRVTMNGKTIHDTNMELNPQLAWRCRSGFIGLQDLGRQIRFRNIQIRKLPRRENWIELFNGADLAGWSVEGDAEWDVAGDKIVASRGDGYLITEESFTSFEFQTYVRTSKNANGGVYYRWSKDSRPRGYEAQIYNVLDTTNPTGSIYGIAPAIDPGTRDGEWFLLQIISDGSYSAVRINGKLVAEAHNLTLPDKGKIALQMHQKESQIEFLRPRIKLLR
jgi:hypothetical protein